MAEKKYKSPEELGEAVGRKIEELFGGIFAEESPQEEEVEKPTQQEPVRSPVNPVPAPKPIPAAAPAPAPVPAPKPVRAPARGTVSPAPGPKPTPAKPQVARPAPVKAASEPAIAPHKKTTSFFDEITEQIEVIILNLEWEVSPESVRELFHKFKELERVFTTEGPGRNILAMNMRILPRFDRPDSVPHPALLKLLQDSVAALKALNAAPTRPPNQALISSITTSYKQIMSAVADVSEPAVGAKPAPEPAISEYGALVTKVGGAVRSLEEVSQRLARILGVLRQGGDMSVEEMTRRLGTLEHLLSERVGQLSSFQKELSAMPKPGADKQPAISSDKGGVLLLVWAGIPLAVPRDSLAGLFPMTRTQAEQFRGKASVTLGPLSVKRLPLRRPQAAPDVLPTWFVHLSRGEKDFFILADKLIGYRRSPRDADIENLARLKVGQTVYTLIRRSMIR